VPSGCIGIDASARYSGTDERPLFHTEAAFATPRPDAAWHFQMVIVRDAVVDGGDEDSTQVLGGAKRSC
jgi:hypothetical protein